MSIGLDSLAFTLRKQFERGLARIHPEAHRDIGSQFERIVEMRFVTGIERRERRLRAHAEQARGHMMSDLVRERGSDHGAMMRGVYADDRLLQSRPASQIKAKQR